MELVAGAGGGWRNNSALEVRMETGRALLDNGIGGRACYNEPTGAGAGGFGGGGGGCAAGGGGGGFAGLYKMLETERILHNIIIVCCVGCMRSNFVWRVEKDVGQSDHGDIVIYYSSTVRKTMEMLTL